MRLTKADKETFVEAVIRDLPHHDYRADVQRLVAEYMRSKMSPQLRQAVVKWGDRFETKLVSVPRIDCSTYVHVITYDGINHPNLDTEAPELWTQLEALTEKAKEQIRTRHQLRTKLKGVIAPITTLKKAAELLPEFKEYLPKERDPMGTDGVPMISNLVAELTKAGWPAGSCSQTGEAS